MQDDCLTIPCAEWQELLATYPAEMAVVAEMLTDAEVPVCADSAS